MFRRKRPSTRFALNAQLLGSDSVDTRDYHGHTGDVIRIEPSTPFKVDKILVVISSDGSGLVERGLARQQPGAREWLYTATAENPEQGDWAVAVTAVRRQGGDG